MLSLPPMDGKPSFSCAVQSAQQGRRRLAPALRLIVQSRSKYSWKVRRDFMRICADRRELGKALHHGVGRAVERREARNPRNIAVSS